MNNGKYQKISTTALVLLLLNGLVMFFWILVNLDAFSVQHLMSSFPLVCLPSATLLRRKSDRFGMAAMLLDVVAFAGFATFTVYMLLPF